MRHSRYTDELLKVFGDELRPVIGDDPRLGLGKFLPRPLQDNLHILLGHRFTQLPVDNVSAETIQNGAQIVKRTANIHIGNIDMPVRVRSERLDKTFPLSGGLAFPSAQQIGFLQHPVNAARADRDNISIQHHEGQTTISLQRMLEVEPDDSLLLPVVKPEVAGYQTIVLIDFAVS